jgi:membrane fusion protein, multidrug efflux system
MKTRRTAWIVLAACLVAASVGAVAMKKRAQAVAEPVVTAPVATAVLEFLPTDVLAVQPRDLRQTLPLSGSLRAVNQVSVKAKVAGDVRDVLVREGEAVKAGQLLIRMDNSDYQARLEQARGSLMAAQGQLDMATKARDNNKALLAKGFISQNAFDNAASQYDIAHANMESAKGALDVAKKALNDTVITAPISGLVSSRSVQPGEKVSADNRLLDVVDLRQMEMEAAVPTSDIMSIAPGQEVQVRVEGMNQPMPGKVARINPAIQAGSRSILVYIQIDNPQGVLRVGMFGEAQLTLAKKTGALSVPQSAIQTEAGNPAVYTIENGKLVLRQVTLGIKGDDGQSSAVEIVKGLENGAQVVKNNLGNLRAGTAVRFAKATAAAANQ